MFKTKELPAVFFSAAIITALFHRQSLGINLFIFTLLLLSYLKITKQIKFESKNQIVSIVGLLISSIFTVLTHSLFSYIMYFFALFLFTGILIYPEAVSLASTTMMSWYNLLNSQVDCAIKLSELDTKNKKIINLSRRLIIFIAPVLIIFFFIMLYRISNLYFDSIVNNSFVYLQDNVFSLFKDFDSVIIFTFFIGIIISNFLIIRSRHQKMINYDKESSEDLSRKRKKIGFRLKFNALKNEYKAGIFLFLVLNLVLLVVNIIDIYWVWFNFEWQGQNLRQFVHEGTYILILSILISLGLVLFFFRKNLNYYHNNTLLKNLCYIWLAQNALLAISVAIRNFWYINYYSLAYRRIGVVIFLVLAIYGLYTVFIKVRQKKSYFYLLKTNSLSAFIVLIICSMINWDSLIANYNFNHSDKSFLHLDFMAELSDQTLPILDKPLSLMNDIDKHQKDIFHLETKFMTPEQYCKVVSERKKAFKKNWESKNILEWNLPEYLAYKSLSSSGLNN